MTSRVLVVAGGLSPERDVSIRSGRRVAEELRAAGFEASVVDIDSNLLPLLKSDPSVCAFPLVHGVAGEDGSLQEVLQSVSTAFVGSDADACRRSFDKAIAGALLAEQGVRVPKSVALPQSMFRDIGAGALLDAITTKLGLPLIIKPNRGGSSLGLSVVHSVEELPAAMVAAFAYSEVVLIQQFIAGTEVAVGVIETETGITPLTPVEIVPDSGIYDYTARYTAGTTEFFAPARVPDKVQQAAAETAATAHRVLGLRDWSRSDLIVDESGNVWFLEVNVAPGMTETSLFPMSVAAQELQLGDVLASLVMRASARS